LNSIIIFASIGRQGVHAGGLYTTLYDKVYTINIYAHTHPHTNTMVPSQGNNLYIISYSNN